MVYSSVVQAWVVVVTVGVGLGQLGLVLGKQRPGLAGVLLSLVLTFTAMLCLCCGVFEMVGHIPGSVDDLLATVLLMALTGRKRFRLAVGMICWVIV